MNKTYNIKEIDNVFELLLSSSLYLKKSWDNITWKNTKIMMIVLCILI